MRALHLTCMIKILTVMHMYTLTTTPYTLSSQTPFLCVGYNISINMLVPNFIIRKFQYNKCFELSSLPGNTNKLVYMNECVITIIPSGTYVYPVYN